MRQVLVFAVVAILFLCPSSISPTNQELPCANWDVPILFGAIDKTAQAWDSLLRADLWEVQPESVQELYWTVLAKTAQDSFEVGQEWNMKRYVLQWDSLTQRERCIVRLAYRWKK